MKIHHIAIWTFHLEKLREFYTRYFNGTSNEKYINSQKGFESYFISFESGATLELMSRIDVQNIPIEENRPGLTHLAFSFESQEAVLSLTEQLRTKGYHIVGEPRISGDGYFESVILDPDGNRIECVYKKEQECPPERNHVIETERLILRPFTENDTEAVFNCCQHPNLGNNAGWKPHDTLEESLKILQTIFIPQKDTWAITRKEDRLLIGAIGILPDPKRENSNAGMIGYWLDEAQWGKGYMSESVCAVLDYGFNKLGLTLISANCYPQNKRSQRVLEKMGFTYEGILHQAEVSYDDKIYDHLCYYLEKNNLK